MTTSDRYLIPAATVRTEILVVNSRFIGSAAYTPSVDAARDFIAQVRTDFPSASHHAYAYLIGHGASVTAGVSDAGEPSGTAGRPMLAVLRGSGLGDITVVVTRYFGGTLLGTGGLTRAYSDTTRAVLDTLPRTERVETCTLMVRVTYRDFANLPQILNAHNATILDERFTTDVILTLKLPMSQRESCVMALAEVTAGQAEVLVH